MSLVILQKLSGAGADLGFSRGVRIFEKKMSKIWSTFFSGRRNYNGALSKHWKYQFGQFFKAAGDFLRKKTIGKTGFKHPLKNFDPKIAFFFGARSPLNLV